MSQKWNFKNFIYSSIKNKIFGNKFNNTNAKHIFWELYNMLKEMKEYTN